MRVFPLLAPLHRRQLKQAVRQMEANVILSWMNRASSMMPDCGVPHVARLGGFYNLKYYAGCDWLVGNTRDVADYLIAEGWPADRVHYQVNFVPDGLSGPVFDGPQSGGPVIAALGRLHVNKAFDTLLRALHSLMTARCGWQAKALKVSLLPRLPMSLAFPNVSIFWDGRMIRRR